MHADVLNFWFVESGPSKWWSASPAFDELIRQRYGAMVEQGARGELYEWRSTARGRLAEIVVLDQFSRNIFRNTARAFAQDSMALALAQEAVAANVLHSLGDNERAFLLLPYMHSESRLIHARAEPLFRGYTPKENYDFELKHKAIVDRFGRYPHRNKVLGRESTSEEIEFLKQPGSSF